MAYTDLTTTFTYGRKCFWTDFNALAVNNQLHHQGLTQHAFYAYKSADQAIAFAAIPTPTALTFGATLWTVGSGYNVGTSIFTAPKTAYYHFLTAAVLDLDTASDPNYDLMIYKNGAMYVKARLTVNVTDTRYSSQVLGCVMELTAADTVQVFLTKVLTANSTNVRVQGEASGIETYFIGRLLVNEA